MPPNNTPPEPSISDWANLKALADTIIALPPATPPEQIAPLFTAFKRTYFAVLQGANDVQPYEVGLVALERTNPEDLEEVQRNIVEVLGTLP